MVKRKTGTVTADQMAMGSAVRALWLCEGRLAGRDWRSAAGGFS